MEPLLKRHDDDAIATLIMNRPDKLNALSYELIDDLLSALDAIEADPRIRSVILTGEGKRAFSAGGDITQFSASVRKGRAAAVNEFVRRGQRLTSRLETFVKPVVAAVNGLAYGGGCEIIEAVPLAVAADSARFAKPEILLGMPPTFGGTQRLPRTAGKKRALELLLTGEPFDAQRALAIGLVNAVAPAEDLMQTARALARRVTRHHPDAVASILRAVNGGADRTMCDALMAEREAFAGLVGADCLNKGLHAWLRRKEH